MTRLLATYNLFDRLVVVNLTLLVLGMVARALPLPPTVAHGVGLGTQVLATIAVLLLVPQMVKTLQSVASLLRGPQNQLAWAVAPDQDEQGHLSRARHWLRRGKTDDSVRTVFGDRTYENARRLNDEEDASARHDR